MKIAVLLSGQMRTASLTLGPLKEFFSDHDVDYFCHSWTNNTWTHKVNGVPIGAPFNEQLNVHAIQAQLAVLNPIDVSIEGMKLWQYETSQSQAYSHYTANQLKNKHVANTGVEYDAVVKCRYDLYFPPNSKFNTVNPLADNTLYVTHQDVFVDVGLDSLLDRIFWANAATMDKICDRHLEFESHAANTIGILWEPVFSYPEAHLFAYVVRNGIAVEKQWLYEQIARWPYLMFTWPNNYADMLNVSKSFDGIA